MASKPSSPFATGGGGYKFESLVGASYLVSLLRGTVTRGIDGVTKIVKFQQKFSGHLLDDIVVITDDGEKENVLSLQVRHKITFSSNNDEFKTLIHECWKMFNNEEKTKFNPATDRLGIVVSHFPQSVKDHILSILEISRNSYNADIFLQNIQSGGHSEKKSQNISMFREFLNDFSSRKITDDELWKFLKTLNIMAFDIEEDTSSDLNHNWNECMYILNTSEQSEAKLLFEKLVNLSTDFSKTSGSITLDLLKQKLTDFQINEPINFMADLKKLRIHSNTVLENIRDTIGNDIVLSRLDVLDNLESKLCHTNILFLRGEPFVGKSAILKLFAKRIRQDGEILAFSVERLDGIDFSNFLRILNIHNEFDGILASIGTSPSRCVFLDGLEQLPYHPNKIIIIRELFSKIQKYNQSLVDRTGKDDYCWKILATCRNQELENVLTNVFKEFSFNENIFFEIPSLSDDEINFIENQNKKLSDIFKKKSLSRILRVPGYLDMFARRIQVEIDQIPEPITESWCYQKFWQQNVRLSDGMKSGKGHAEDRENIMKLVGIQALKGENILLDKTQLSSDAIDGLLSDKLIRKTNNRLLPDNDVFEDYALTTVIADNENRIKDFFLENKNTRRLLRPFNLYVSKILEIDRSAQQWYELLQKLQYDNISPIWRYECLTATIMSETALDNISLIREFLLSEQGNLLRELLSSLRAVAVTTDPTILQLVKDPNDPITQEKILYYTTPLLEKWEFVIKFTFDNFHNINDDCIFEFYKIINSWISNTKNILLKKQIGEFTIKLFEDRFSDKFEINSSLSYDDKKSLRKLLIKTIIFSTNCIPEKVDDFLKNHAFGKKNDDFDEVIISEYGWWPICQFLPKTAVNLIESMICNALPKDDDYGFHDLVDLGINSFYEINPPTPNKGPFLIFLKLHENEGLDLIHRIVNHSTKAWKLGEESYDKKKPLPQTIHLTEKSIDVYGDETVFRWYRFLSRAKPELTSALMALEKWMEIQIDNGISVKELFEKVLSGTKSVAIIAVCIAVALKYHKISHGAILPILENPAFWYMDFKRLSEDLRSESSITNFSRTFSFTPNHKSDYDVLIKQAAEEHRKRHLGDFVTQILLTGSQDVRTSMQSKLKNFPNNIPFFFEEEKKDSSIQKKRKRECELWSERAKIENYKKSRVGDDTIMLEFNLDILLTNEEKKQIEYDNLILKLHNFMSWTYALMDENKIVGGFTMESAIEYLEKLDNDFISTLDNMDRNFLLDSYANFIGALIIHRWDEIKNLKREKWCLTRFDEILKLNYHEESDISIYPMGLNRAVARTLPSLLLKFPNEQKIQKAIIECTNEKNNEVLQFLFQNLKKLWNVNDDIILRCITNTTKNCTNLKDMFNETYTDWPKHMSIFYALFEIPEINNEKTRLKLKEIFENLLNFTIQSYHKGQTGDRYNDWALHSYTWNHGFFQILGNFILKFHEVNSTMLKQIDDNWEQSPALMEDFLRQLLLVGTFPAFEKKLIEIWRHYFDKILNSNYTKKSNYESGDYKKAILGLLIFTDPEKIVIWKNPEWLPLYEMTDYIDKWCHQFSTNFDCLTNLIELLNTIGSKLVPRYGIGWLTLFLNNIEKENLSQNLISKLSTLLWRTWHSYEHDLKKNSQTYEQFVNMVDLLVDRNDVLAQNLKNKLT